MALRKESMMAERYGFERYLNIRTAYGASFSPDGTHIGFLTDITGVPEVWSVPIDLAAPTPWPEQLTFRGERVASATFSPSDEILLVSADIGGNERMQLHILGADGAAFTALTEQPEVIHQFGGWSPDGTGISYASNERDNRFFDVYERPVSGGEPRCLLQQDGTNYAERYSPDGRFVLVARYDSNIRNRLFLVDRTTGEVRALTPKIEEGPALHAFSSWAADGRSLYLLSDRGRQFFSLALLDLASGEMAYLRDDTWGAEWLEVSHDGTQLALVTNEDGYSRLELFDVSNGWEGRRTLKGPALPAGVLSELTWSRDGKRLAFTFNAANYNPDVWMWDLEKEMLWQATRSTTGGIPRESFVSPSLVRYPTFDEREIPAFFFAPEGGQPRELPVVIYVHGGPESQFRPTFNSVIQYLVARGYGVFAPNVRGSTGYGYEYQSLDDVRLRMDSVKDLQYAVRWLVESSTADARRIAVMGGSYGGFMVLSSMTTYPDLWAAGVDIVGVANFVTFLENTGPWRRKLREPEYGTLEHDREFLEQISPINSVERIAAPLFVVHGANDPRVPLEEAEQIVTAVRKRGLPVEYLVFPDEGHGLVKRANRLAAYPSIARFLDEHLRQR
jgi:dipeptidyl aminopeptidase/acylaminoacyl peptidase